MSGMNARRDWTQMSDRDKGCAVRFVSSLDFYEQETRALREDPVLYRDHPRLAQLGPVRAADHARGLAAIIRALPEAEWWRLYQTGRPTRAELARHQQPRRSA